MRVAMAIARGLAAARGDVNLSPTHVALGLIRESENAAVAALHHADVPLHKIRRDLEMDLGELGVPRPEEVAVSLTDGERRLVEEAINQSRLCGDRHLGSEHLLLAILQDDQSSAAQVFRRYGFLHDTALTHLAAVLHKHEPSTDSSAHAV
jgi:ATP-dependent Clp protease ATP-binding subunit ClpC